VEKNVKEIVLTGVNTSGYNSNGKDLFFLLKEINKIDGDFRIRISSLEPFQINKKMIDLVITNKDRFCQTFHLCLQNSNDQVLKRMNRIYDFNYFSELCLYIRLKNKYATITTDYIVGYIDETKEEFTSSIMNLRKLKLNDMHLFPYSLHKNTPSASSQHLVNDSEKKKRFLLLEEINKNMKNEQLKKYIGKTCKVLFEKSNKPGIAIGLSEYFFHVYVKTDENWRNEFKLIKITKITDNEIWGKEN